MSDRKLYVIIPYFNHTNARVSERNLELCLRNLSINADCRVVLVEGIWNREAELLDCSYRIFRHLKFDLQSPIWVKENLINLGIESLGVDWEFAAWIDKDIQFINPDWAEETMLKLEESDILQPWSRILFMNKNHEVDDTISKLPRYQSLVTLGRMNERGWYSFCYQGECHGQMGHAWAIRRTFFKKIGKLYDVCISGSGDQPMSMAIRQARGKNDFILNGMPFPGYESALFQRYAGLFEGVKTAHVTGTIIHHHHGELTKRSYAERHQLVLDQGFDPERDLSYAANGTIRMHNEKLERDLLEYFYSREEHLIP